MIRVIYVHILKWFSHWTPLTAFLIWSTLAFLKYHTSRTYGGGRTTLRLNLAKRSIIGQLNVPVATVENQEQYTLSNIVYNGFQNFYSFLWS